MQAMNAMEVRIVWWGDDLSERDIQSPVMQLEILRFLISAAEKVTAQPDIPDIVKASAAAVFSACRAADLVVREGLEGDVEPAPELGPTWPPVWRDVCDVRAFCYVLSGQVGYEPHWRAVQFVLWAFDSACVTALSDVMPGQPVNEEVLDDAWGIV